MLNRLVPLVMFVVTAGFAHDSSSPDDPEANTAAALAAPRASPIPDTSARET